MCCVLFSNHATYNAGLVKTVWRDFHKPTERLDKHFNASYHHEAAQRCKDFVITAKNPEKSISLKINSRNKEIHNNNVQVLTEVISALDFLAKQGLPLRGHRDDSTNNDASNQGNFIELLKHAALAQKDGVLANHLKNCKKNARYTSKGIQNELLSIIADLVREDIVKQVQDVKFFSVLADEVTDCANQEQLCVCLRFVNLQTMTVCEEFLDFVPVERITGEALYNHIKSLLNRLHLDLDMVRGQGYDGAANMSSMRVGVAGRLQAVNSKALYSHCSSHKLNLAIVKSASIPAIRNASNTMGEISRYFKSSPKRERYLETVILEVTDKQRAPKLKDVCLTRWIERHHAYSTFMELYHPIVEAMVRIQLDSDEQKWDMESKSKAYGFHKCLTSSDFIISMHVVHNLLSLIQPLSVKLQGQTVDVQLANSMVSQTIRDLETCDEETFHKWFQDCEAMAASVGEIISKPRLASHQRHRHNPDCEQSVEEYYRAAIFRQFADFLCTELRSRFTDDRFIVNRLCALTPAAIAKNGGIDTEDIISLSEFYYSDLPVPSQLITECQRWSGRWIGCTELPSTITEALKVS